MEKLKAVIVDDHKLFRKGLSLILSEIENVAVIGEASDGKEFLDFIETRGVDLVFMDINMPVINGIDATIAALAKYPSMKIIVLSMHGEEAYYEKMVDAGVKGFLLKNSDSLELEKAVQIVIEGDTYFSQELLMNIIKQKSAKKISEDNIQFTDREMDVLHLLCKGHSNAEIADKLFISQRTADRHRANLLSKTGCKNAISLVIYAVKNHVIDIE
ncbi:MAG: response regulator transcription factor [Bacteroidales bacterium]|nr:response regulator transcription factor [Bacteroidales bacterium]